MPEMLGHLYNLLAVPFTASTADIRAAYLRRSLETHPDKGGDEHLFREVRPPARPSLHPALVRPGSHADAGLLSQIKEAYEILSDASSRRSYDLRQGFSFSFTATSSSAGGSAFSFSSASSFSSADPRSFSSSSGASSGKHPRPPSDDPRTRPPKRSSFSSASFGASASSASSSSAGASFGGRATEERWKRTRKTSASTEKEAPDGGNKAAKGTVVEEKDEDIFEFAWC